MSARLTPRWPTLSEVGFVFVVLGAVFVLIGRFTPVERHELVPVSGIVRTVHLVPPARYRCAQIKIVIQSASGTQDLVVCDSEKKRR